MTAPSITALRGSPVPPGSRPGTATVALRRLPAPRHDPLLPGCRGRLVGLVLLTAFGAHHWMLMLEPAATARAWYAVAAAAAVAGALWAVRPGAPAAPRTAAAVLIVAAGGALALLAAGGGDELLAPPRWDELAAGIARGVDGLPGARVPYEGVDEWLRLVLALGGTALAVLAAALAYWPRRGERGFPAAAVVALVALYAVPSVVLDFGGEFVRGAVLALLVLAFLRLERLRRREAPAAAAAAAAAASVAALVLAPALDGLDPWWDYEGWALGSAAAQTTSFYWEHDYGPLRWPRDGRELLRVEAPMRAYWKADQLDVFNGRAWVRDRSAGGAAEPPQALVDGVPAERLERWTARIQVMLRHLESETFVTAGTTREIDMPQRAALVTSRPGIHRTTPPLRRGDGYTALAYVPRPSERELRTAGTRFGRAQLRYTRVGVRTGGEGLGLGGEPRTTVVDVRGFGAEPTRAVIDPRAAPEGAGDLLVEGELRRVWRLARRLVARSATPYEYVRRVEAHLRRGFQYSERPPPASASLDGFLFETRTGYCQQFSGAMALLLRLGGIPARVATGFSPGSYDEETGEFVVRDTDAHSWVETWFAGIGWLTRDPTPSGAEPERGDGGARPGTALAGVHDVGATTRPGVSAPAQADRSWLGVVIGAGLVAALLAAGSGALRGGRRPRAHGGSLGELERALQVAGSQLPAATTLASLERRFAATPEAAAYVRTVRAQRFSRVARGPTTEQRRALRRALGAGGPLRRLRSYWAVPPRPWR